LSGEWVAYYVGSLKSFNNRTGYGFLECEMARTDWGSDVFIHKNFVPTPWNLGQPVEFAVTTNSRGQAQAVDVNWLPRLPINVLPIHAAVPVAGTLQGAGMGAPTP
jgi:cold shock CspA family protein